MKTLSVGFRQASAVDTAVGLRRRTGGSAAHSYFQNCHHFLPVEAAGGWTVESLMRDRSS